MNKGDFLLTLMLSFLTTLLLAQKVTRNGFQNGKKADRPLKEIHYLPRNYTGKVAVIFNQPQGKMIEYAGDYRIYRIPGCGILKTNFLIPDRISYSSVNEDVLFVYMDEKGAILDTLTLLPDFRYVSDTAYNEFMKTNKDKVFVFFWTFGGFSNTKEKYRHVEFYIIDSLKNSNEYKDRDMAEYDSGKCN